LCTVCHLKALKEEGEAEAAERRGSQAKRQPSLQPFLPSSMQN